MSLSLSWATVACGSSTDNYSSTPSTNVSSRSQGQVKQGEYPVQQAEYNDATGEYSVMLLNTPAGVAPVFRTTDLQMARLTEEQIKAGKSSHLKVNNNQAVLNLTEDFKIQYVHNVTENQVNPQTGRQEVVVVRQESSFWTPFAGAIAGQVVANALFTPQYYVPPVYQPGVSVMRGYGGYGNTYDTAVNRYQTRYQEPPASVKNRQVLRTTGNVRSTSTPTSQPNTTNTKTKTKTTTTTNTNQNNSRSTGSGVGSSDLSPSNNSRKTTAPKKRNSGFGSSKPSGSKPSRSRKRR
ncbi:MAG: hypothetical protein WA999_02095 [Spirulinaceae cyanobacterium]